MRFKEVKNALWLVLSCSQTGSLAAVPLQSKGQLSLMCRETMTFIQNLGHTEVGLYADNEPTMRALLRILLNSRHVLGLRTRIYTTRMKDSAGNSLAENAIQRIRGLAGTLMESLMKKVGLRFSMDPKQTPSQPRSHKLRIDSTEIIRVTAGSIRVPSVCILEPSHWPFFWERLKAKMHGLWEKGRMWC